MKDRDISYIDFHKVLQEAEKYYKLNKADIKNQEHQGKADHKRTARRFA